MCPQRSRVPPPGKPPRTRRAKAIARARDAMSRAPEKRDDRQGLAVHCGMADAPGTGVWPRRRQTQLAILTAATIVTILLVCLYPFRFSVRHGNINAIGALVGRWAKPPEPIDFILNIALYTPLGVFGELSLSPRPRRRWQRIGSVTAGAALLSIAVELTQYFDA